MDFDLQVKMFTDQLVELIEQAKDAAALEFQTERANWEQERREYEATIEGLDSEIRDLNDRLNEAEMKYEALRSKLTALV